MSGIQKGNVKLHYKNRSSVLRKIKHLGLIAGEFECWGSGRTWVLRIKNAGVLRLNLQDKGYFIK